MATTEEEEEVVLKVNQGINMSDEKQSLMSTSKYYWPGERVDNATV